MKVVGGSASKGLAKQISKGLGCEYYDAETTRFPDGECYTRLSNADLDGEDVILVQNTYPDESIIEMLLLQDTIRSMGAKTITLVIPYFGYGRQDRVFKRGEANSASVMIRLLSLNCDKVITVDIHKEDILDEFKCPAVDIKAAPAFAKHFLDRKCGIDLVLAPDVGASARAKAVGDLMGVPHDHLEKVRISGTEVRISPATIDCKGKSILIVDDMISTGGTIVAAKAALKDAGAKRVIVACCHGVFVNNALSRLVEDGGIVLTCNTLYNPLSKISVSELIVGAILEGVN